MWVTYFVIFVFIVLLVVGFWQSRFGSSSASTALPMAQTDESMLETESVQPTAENAQPGQAPVYQQSTQPHNEIPVTQLDHSPTATESPTPPSAAVADSAHVETVQQQATVDATQDTAGSAPLSEQSAAEPAVASAENLSGPQSPVVQTTEPQTEPSVEQPVTPTAETPVLTPTVTTPDPQSTVQAETNATISLSLSAECWVDVVDATGKRLVFGSRQAGEQLNLRGVAPVKVLLGNAAAATLSFNGEAIDLSGYPTGRVARLTLGQN
jgi:cytoskeleton protein RodZ